MKLPVFPYWIAGMNAVGLLLSLLYKPLYSRGRGRWMERILVAVSVLGGPLGVLMGSLLSEWRIRKENAMVRVASLCMLIIQLTVLWVVKRNHSQELSFAFWEFFRERSWLQIYLIAVSAISLGAYGADKHAAVAGKRRIPVAVLLGLAAAGGSPGALAGMYLFRHKTRKNYFVMGIPLIMAAQAAVIFWLMNIV